MNKVKFGLKNAYYAPITEGENGVETYGTPVAIPGAVSMSLSPSGETTEFYADDSLYFSDENNNGYEGTMEFALIPDSFKIDCLGMTQDTNGVIVENATAINKPFAFLCEITGDEKARRFAFYRCMASRPDLGANTKGESAEVQTETLNLTIRPNSAGMVKASTSAETQTATYNSWYTSVYTPVANS